MREINLGRVTAYADAVNAGYTGTREEFAVDLANAATYAAEAGDSAAEAKASEDAAALSASAAAQAAVEAAGSEDAVHADAVAAQAAKTDAIAAKDTAVSKAGEAANSASAAGLSAAAASASETAAGAYANTASSSATSAIGSASAAAESASAAEDSATEAASALGDVTAAKTEALAAIQTKGEETLESIPEDYTTLRNDVSSLKSDINVLMPVTLDAESGDSVAYIDNAEGGYWRFINNAWQFVHSTGVAYYHAVTFPVEQLKTYRVVGWHTAYAPLATFWTDDSTVPVGCSEDGYSSTQANEAYTLDIKIPVGVTKIIVTMFRLANYPTVNEIDWQNKAINYTDAYINSIKYLKTTGFVMWDSSAYRIKIKMEGNNGVITFPYRFFVSGSTSTWVKTIQLSNDPTYTKTISTETGGYIVYDPTANDVICTNWSGMSSLSAERDDYLLLGMFADGTLFGALGAVITRNLQDEIDSVALPIPYYYNDYMSEKMAEVESASSYINGVSFVFITDTHLRVNAKQSGKLIKYLRENTNAVPFVIFGGDVPDAVSTEEATMNYAEQWLKYMRQWGADDTIQVHGNHDYMCNIDGGGSFHCAVGQLNYFIAQNSDLLVRPAGALYGYYDAPSRNVRIIITDDYSTGYNGNVWNGGEGYTQNQLDFIKSAILGTEGNVIVVSHQTGDTAMSNYITDPSLQTMLIAARNKTGDFASWNGTLVMHLSGHSHNDESHVENNLLSVATICDAGYTSPSGYTRTWGTVNEQAFDVVCVDTDNRTIKMVRIGAGVNRNFTY